MNKMFFISMLLLCSMFSQAADSVPVASSSSARRGVKTVDKTRLMLDFLHSKNKISIELSFADALEEIVDSLPIEKMDLFKALLIEASKKAPALNVEHLKNAMLILDVKPGLDPTKVDTTMLSLNADEGSSRRWENTKNFLFWTGMTTAVSFGLTKAVLYYYENVKK